MVRLKPLSEGAAAAGFGAFGAPPTLCANEVEIKDLGRCNQIPTPRESIKRLLDAANVKLPEALPCRGIKVTTKKKLTERRKRP